MKPERNTLSAYTTFLIKLQNPISLSYYPSPRSKPIRQSPDEAHEAQVCSNALIGAARAREGERGRGKRTRAVVSAAPFPGRAIRVCDHDAGGVSHLPRSEGPEQAFWAPKEKQGGWADFGGLWYNSCLHFKCCLRQRMQCLTWVFIYV